MASLKTQPRQTTAALILMNVIRRSRMTAMICMESARIRLADTSAHVKWDLPEMDSFAQVRADFFIRTLLEFILISFNDIIMFISRL